MILKELVDLISTRLQEKTFETYENIRQWIYDAKIDMMKIHKFECMKAEYEITTDGHDEYLLPMDFNSLQKLKLGRRTIVNQYSNVANDVYFKILAGLTVGTTISAVSSNADDTRKISVRDNDGMHEEIILTGITPAVSTAIFDDINSVWKDETEGDITIKDSADNVLFILPCSKLDWQILKLKLNVFLSSGILRMQYLKKIQKLTDDYDTDDLQINLPEVMIEYCLMRGFDDQDNDAKFTKHFELYNKTLKDAISDDNRKRNKHTAASFEPMRK